MLSRNPAASVTPVAPPRPNAEAMAPAPMTLMKHAVFGIEERSQLLRLRLHIAILDRATDSSPDVKFLLGFFENQLHIRQQCRR